MTLLSHHGFCGPDNIFHPSTRNSSGHISGILPLWSGSEVAHGPEYFGNTFLSSTDIGGVP